MSTQKSERNSDNFIMLPTVDFCFKELMQNPKVRKGFIAAILGKAHEMIRRTTLLPTALRKESEEDKLGILDVLVELEDGSKMNMEMQVSYLILSIFLRIKNASGRSSSVIRSRASSIRI